MLEAFLQMQRLWIIDGTAEFFRLQMLHQLIAVSLTDADAVLIKHVTPVRFDFGKDDRVEDPFLSEHFRVLVGVLLACFGPGIEFPELHSQNRSL